MDNKIIEDLYRAYGRQIYLYLVAMCRNRQLAEDLLHETFVKAILSLPDGHTNMRAWLYKVARNLCINNLERYNKQKPYDGQEANFISDSVLTEENILKKEKYRIMYKSLEKLDLRKREIIMMQYFGNVPLNEIGRILGLSKENVRVLSYRAKKELRKYMEVEGYDLP